MIDGLSHLLTLRKQGLRPASLWLSIDIPYKRPKYEYQFRSMELVAHGNVKADDFRAFVGLQVILYAPKWNDLAADCFGRLKEYADEITVLCCDYGDDIGFLWSKKYGQMDMGIIGWLDQFYEAKGRVCRTDKETQERIRLENEAKANVPNLEDYRGDIS